MYDIGSRIKQLRIKYDLTLAELASRTELTKGFLSQLERNLTSPSIQTLEYIAEALGVTMAEFFAEEEDEKVVFSRADAFVDEQEGITINWIVPNAQKNAMEPILLELFPHQCSKKIDPHMGEEMGYVLCGRVYLVSAAKKKGLLVKAGSTFYIRGNDSHYLENRSDKKARVLWISTPPIF